MKVLLLLVGLLALSAEALQPNQAPVFPGGVRGVRPMTTQTISHHTQIDGTGRHGYQFGDGPNPFVTGDFAEANSQNMADVMAEEQIERDVKSVAQGGAQFEEPKEGAKAEGGEKSEGGEKPHFTYFGKTGPFFWGELDSAWGTCKEGKAQSPINFSTSKEAKPFAKVLNLEYPEGKVKTTKAINNGHSLQMDITAGAKLSLPDGDKEVDYDLKQLHFHSGSEHTVDGKHYEFEMHLVHVSKDKKIAVLGIFFQAEEGKEDNAFLKKFFDEFPAEEGEKEFEVALGLADLLNSIPNKSLWHYQGSLTTPPCTEGVQWFVMQHALPASQAQRDLFMKFIGPNYRPTQPLNDRVVTELKDNSK